MASTVGYWPRKSVASDTLHVARFDLVPGEMPTGTSPSDVFEYASACGAKVVPQAHAVTVAQLNIAPTAKAVLEMVDGAQRARLCGRCVARVRAAA